MIKNLLRFITPIIILAIALTIGTNNSKSIVLEESIDNSMSQIDATYIEPATIDFELFFPRQISSTNILRLQNTTKRINSTQKNNLTHFNSSQIENLRIKNFTNEKSSIIHSSFIKPFHRLICLGKLII